MSTTPPQKPWPTSTANCAATALPPHKAASHLSNTTEETINSQSVQTTRYTRAVYCYTKALLLEKYADTDATGKTGTRAEAKQEQAEDYRRDAHFAVADILGRRRCDAALI